MDGLVMARVTLVRVTDTPRDHVVPVIRGGLEKVTDATERAFTELRKAMRACAIFQRLTEEARAQIGRDVFEVRAARD